MNQAFRSGITFLVAIIVVLGGLYLIDKYSGWKPLANSTLLSEIKRSVGIASPVENGGSERDLPFGHEDAATGKRQGQVFRCDVNGKTIYADTPCDGSRSKIVELKQSAGIQTADPWEVAKFKAQTLAANITAEPKPVPSEPSRVNSVRARCDKLEKYIVYLDERARQPLSGSELDSIKQEKKIWRQEKSDLDCMHA